MKQTGEEKRTKTPQSSLSPDRVDYLAAFTAGPTHTSRVPACTSHPSLPNAMALVPPPTREPSSSYVPPSRRPSSTPKLPPSSSSPRRPLPFSPSPPSSPLLPLPTPASRRPSRGFQTLRRDASGSSGPGWRCGGLEDWRCRRERVWGAGWGAGGRRKRGTWEGEGRVRKSWRRGGERRR